MSNTFLPSHAGVTKTHAIHTHARAHAHTQTRTQYYSLSLPLVLRVRLRRPLLVLCLNSLRHYVDTFWIIHTHFDAHYYTHQSRRRREEKAALRRDDDSSSSSSWSSFERYKALRSLRGERLHRRGPPNTEDGVERNQLRRHRSDGSILHHHRDAKE